MLGATTPAFQIKLCGVLGFEGRTNDVIYCHPLERVQEQSTVVFFGGDMQDFIENMQSHRDSRHYTKYSLENTARTLNASFPTSHCVVIRPCQIEFKTFSCFKNFVPCNNCGAPDHTPMHFAIQHMEKLLETISQRVGAMSAWELKKFASSNADEEGVESQDSEVSVEDKEMYWWSENLNLPMYNLVIIGFSKGAVVLNQFLYEFHYLKTLTPDDSSVMGIVSRIKDMYWLDGGHSGGKNTWITSRPLLETFTRLGIGVHIHVTPYQIQDDRRPWIRKEEKSFGDLLRRMGAKVHRTVHFENIPPNLITHFDVLGVFHSGEVQEASKTSDKSQEKFK